MGIPPASASRTWPPEKATGSHAKSLKDPWFAVCTVPRYEKLVHARLMAKQIQSFLPLYTAVRLQGVAHCHRIDYTLLLLAKTQHKVQT